MAFYQFKQEQKIKASIDEIWKFISSPKNLKEITPPHMGFDITSGDLSDKMYEGMIIRYRVSPFPGFRTTWVTEITHLVKGQYFVDEQRVGPYALWHHQHHIDPVEGGVLMTDVVSYRPPLGFLGVLANRLLIKQKLSEIFEYRRIALEKRYGSFK